MDLTVIEHDEVPLHDRVDREFRIRIVDLYRDEFDVEILTNTREKALEPTDGGVRLRVERDTEERTLDAERLFVFTDRRPAVDSPGLSTDAVTVSREKRAFPVSSDEQTVALGYVGLRWQVLSGVVRGLSELLFGASFDSHSSRIIATSN